MRSAECRSVEAVDRRELGDLGALQAMGLVLGESESDQAGHNGLGGESNHFADLVLAGHHHRGDHASEPSFASSEEDAPAKRVDRRPADERVTAEVPVECREPAKIRDHQQQDGHFVEMLRETPLAGCGGEFGGVGARLRFGFPIGDRRPRNEASRAHRQVLVPAFEVEISETSPDGLILYHHNPPRLPVTAARSEPRIVEDAKQHFVRNRFIAKLPGGACRAESFYEVHHCKVPVR
jgi:hypothetical protein